MVHCRLTQRAVVLKATEWQAPSTNIGQRSINIDAKVNGHRKLGLGCSLLNWGIDGVTKWLPQAAVGD